MSPASATSVSRSAATPSVEREWNLLLAASRTDPGERDLARIRTLLEDEFDWEAVLRLADDHGTSSLLYKTCLQLNDSVPSPVLATLRTRYERNVQKSLFLARELIRVLDCAAALGIDAIPYKGLVLSEAYYGDMAMRQSGDIDLFVRKSDVALLKNAVRDLGYTPRVLVPEAAWRDYIASGYECSFDNFAGKNLLELQWALQPRFYAVNFDMSGLFQRAVNVSVAGSHMKTPSPEDLLLVLSVHAAKHVWERLIWLCDIAQILKRQDLHWDWVQARSREYGIERIVHVTLLLLNRFLAAPLPAKIESMVMADKGARAFADEIAVNLNPGVWRVEQQLPYFRLMMRSRERRADRVRFLMRLAFTPGPGDWDTIRLPRLLFPLYRVVRLARLAARFARD